ncbi:hypothetical protein AK812_SmicGene39257 [Symbiodinium microadriaticum]|uniref:Uncharacterized protein n=1 Tax=Symbiodinium microadriaticum TaxID=2951 RepID=A0A1Q9CBM5_SYMMI|nr:hypothetical protein AK812_SmicGene39257 [Symbiodinium microadriaticum]
MASTLACFKRSPVERSQPKLLAPEENFRIPPVPVLPGFEELVAWVFPRAWSSSPQPKASSKLRYDQMKIPQADMQRLQTLSPDSPTMGHSALMREVQKMVSMARKADGRVRKLKEEQSKRETQWKLFAKKSREDFLTEQKNYEADMKRLAVEIQTATQKGVEASAEVKDIIAHGVRPQDPAMETTDAWDALLEEPSAPAEPSGFLREALAAAENLGSRRAPGPASGDGRLMQPEQAARLLAATLASLPPGTDLQQFGLRGPAPAPSPVPPPLVPEPLYHPPQPVQRDPTLGPPTYCAMSPGTREKRTEPYPATSPLPVKPDAMPATEQDHKVPPPVLHPGQRDPSQHRDRTDEEPPRSNVKDATKTLPTKGSAGKADIQAKLDAKRSAAMQPFRGAGPQPTPPPVPDSGQTNTADGPPGLIDDDNGLEPQGEFMGME